eukprot:2844228-Rhodomonas_salina.1
MWGKRFALATLVATLVLANAKVTLKQKGILGVPVSYTTVATMDGASYGYDQGAGEQMAIDMMLSFAYVVGETGLMHVSAVIVASSPFAFEPHHCRALRFRSDRCGDDR